MFGAILAKTVCLENCSVKCELSTSYNQSIGGIVGQIKGISGKTTATINNVSFEGNITISSTSSTITAGLLFGTCNFEDESCISNCSLNGKFVVSNKSVSDLSGVNFAIKMIGVITANNQFDIKNVVVNGSIEGKDGIVDDPTHKGYYDDGDDTVDTDFSEWFIHENFNEGKPSLRGLYWIGANFEEQDIKSKLDDLGYLDLNHQDSSEEVA